MIDHPDPDLVPRLNWGDPIPLIWQRVSIGVWRVWPPKEFVMNSPNGEILWELGSGISDGSFFKPASEITFIAPGTCNEIGFGHDAPTIDWGGALPCRWSRYEDGRATVQIGSLNVRCGNGLIYFRHHYRSANFLYPSYVKGVELMLGDFGSAQFMGNEVDSGLSAQGWRRQINDNRWRMGSLIIDPPLTEFTGSNELLPLELPSDTEIEQERLSYLPDYALKRGDIHYLTMTADLARSDEFMDRVGDDSFSSQVQRFLADNDLVRIADGAIVHIGSERNYGVILSILRRYGENYMMYNSHWAEAEPNAQSTIQRIFEDVGYTVKIYPKEDHELDIGQIWDTMPIAIKTLTLKKTIFGKQKYPNTLVLAVLMGHFWSEGCGWDFKEGDLSENPLNGLCLQGGHLPTALKISEYVKSRK